MEFSSFSGKLGGRKSGHSNISSKGPTGTSGGFDSGVSMISEGFSEPEEFVISEGFVVLEGLVTSEGFVILGELVTPVGSLGSVLFS